MTQVIDRDQDDNVDYEEWEDFDIWESGLNEDLLRELDFNDDTHDDADNNTYYEWDQSDLLDTIDPLLLLDRELGDFEENDNDE